MFKPWEAGIVAMPPIGAQVNRYQAGNGCMYLQIYTVIGYLMPYRLLYQCVGMTLPDWGPAEVFPAIMQGRMYPEDWQRLAQGIDLEPPQFHHVN